MTTASLSSYLAHLGCRHCREPSITNLRTLHHNHLMTVAFENMSSVLGEKVELQQDWIFQKIVTRCVCMGGEIETSEQRPLNAARGRGGFCFELNGMYNWMRESLGYQVIFTGFSQQH